MFKFSRYKYEWKNDGLLLRTPAGTCWIHGQKGAELLKRLEKLDHWQMREVLKEYEYVRRRGDENRIRFIP